MDVYVTRDITYSHVGFKRADLELAANRARSMSGRQLRTFTERPNEA